MTTTLDPQVAEREAERHERTGGPDPRPWSTISRSEQADLRAPFAGLPPAGISALMRGSGFRTPEAVALATDEALLAVQNFGPSALKAFRERFPRVERIRSLAPPIGPIERLQTGAARCGACNTPFLVRDGHGVYDCIAALARRLRTLEHTVDDN